MINTRTRPYTYFTFGDYNSYGQRSLSETPNGTINMSITTTSQSIQDNINYSGAQYLGLTFQEIDDTFVIKYGDKTLKVLYVCRDGKYNQVFMAEI